MPEAAFIEKIREEFPAVQGDFCLFRVDRQRRIHRLELTSVCPAAIKACSVLRRSAVYIRKMINSADTLDDAREAVSETAEELALMGALRHLRSLEHRKELMEAVLQFYCEGRINAALTQFKDGLTTLGVLQMVTSHPQAFEKVFLYDPAPLKASDIVELFHARCRSLPASNRRRLEARTIAFWKDWLLEVEGGLAHPITLEHVLIFATGLQRIPAVGFPMQPELAFLHPDDGLARFPKANTCSLVLHLPVGQTYTEFKNNMELGLGCASQFGEA
ncbi:G2/M phase-specific E3 ubiquitin-protein ligase-like isoform X2 [Astyanax mexicanus]|uniref:G2/M phase-specific E3 ubiquitin-protein ligase-like isoform X2 n=1 Tax=Astyanax mexicanus TaxID=7994 RepID=UPI0020CABE83|nr:G2/M phase-specific E3 ubiquitin-protein ligase-like isoform X2 [Astyanax mexicanus]